MQISSSYAAGLAAFMHVGARERLTHVQSATPETLFRSPAAAVGGELHVGRSF